MGPGPDNKGSFPDKSFIRAVSFTLVVFALMLAAISIFSYFISRTEDSEIIKTEKKQAQKIELPKVLYNLAGLVLQLEKSSFIIEASVPQIDDNGQLSQKTDRRKVNITSATRITRLTFVSQEGRSGKAPVETPMAFKDIKVGDYIEVISSQDISQASEFEATQARFLPKNF